MRTKQILAALGAALAVLTLTATPLLAHHAFSAEFDVKQPITLKGTLVKWEMINPHSWFHVEVKDPDGKVTERLWRIDANTLGYKFTVDDPGTWAQPWTAEAPMTKSTGPIFEHACHEGNFGLYNTLVGARLEEKKGSK